MLFKEKKGLEIELEWTWKSIAAEKSWIRKSSIVGNIEETGVYSL